MIRRRAGLLLLSAALAGGCGRGGGADAPRAAEPAGVPRAEALEAAARPLLVKTVRDSLQANPYHRDSAPWVADSLWIQTVASAVPGLTYHWGLFRPPGSYHVGPFTALAARLGDSLRVLRDADDWWMMARLRSWRPRTAAEAAAACGELGTLRAGHPRVVAYADTSSGLFRVIIPPARDSVQRRVHPPRAVRARDGAWDATVWMIHPQRVVRQRCRFPTPRERGGVRITRVDSLEAPMIWF